MKVGKKGIISTRHDKTLTYALQAVKESAVAPYVTGLFLYGSFARKQYSWNSDVDLLLELSEDIPIDMYRDDMIRLKSIVTPTDPLLPEVDLKIVVGYKWRTDQMLYYKNVRKDGVNIWDT